MAVKEKLLDHTVVRRSAGAILLPSVPLAVATRLASSNDMGHLRAWWWVIGLGVLLVLFALGGRSAARRSPELPLSHSAAAAGTAYVMLVIGSWIAALVTGTHVSSAFVYLAVLLSAVFIGAAMFAGLASERGSLHQGQ
jgi:hypothetical protein